MVATDFSTGVVPVLRPCIQAKLQEIVGSGLPKDLPEYVIVMLSNKKTKEYILSQFIDILGEKQSEIFVKWLFKKIEDIEKGIGEAGPTMAGSAREQPSEKKRSDDRGKDKERRDRDRRDSHRRERDRKDSHRDHRPRIEPKKVERRQEAEATSPPRPKVASAVVVKRKMADSKAINGGSSIFRRAMTATTKEAEQRKRKVDGNHNMEVEEKQDIPQKRRSVLSRLTRESQSPPKAKAAPTVVKRKTADLKSASGGSSIFRRAMTATAKDAEKQKRKVDGNLTVTIERKPLSERLSRADGSRCSVEEKEKETTPPPQTWNYQIELSDNESDSEDEAMIDAVVADTSGDEKGHSSSQEDHMQPEERAFFVRTAVNKVHFNPAHPSFANKDGSVNQEAIQEVAPMVVSANSAPQAGPPCTKYQTRCRFWPNCNQSDEICPYAHPSIPCTKFPHCRFGDRCLYVHPICRYGMLCRNTYCGYLHPTKTSNLTYMKPVADTSQPMAT